MKMAILTALTSVKRVWDIQSLTINKTYLEGQQTLILPETWLHADGSHNPFHESDRKLASNPS